MEPRIDYLKVGRGVYEAMLGSEKYLRQCGLDETLLDLIKLRVSQFNGCAYYARGSSVSVGNRLCTFHAGPCLSLQK